MFDSYSLDKLIELLTFLPKEMDMDGQVVLLNQESSRIAIKNRTGEYAVADIVKGPFPEKGDFISGAFSSLGSASLVNLTQKSLIRVKITHTQDPVAQRARQLLLGRS